MAHDLPLADSTYTETPTRSSVELGAVVEQRRFAVLQAFPGQACLHCHALRRGIAVDAECSKLT